VNETSDPTTHAVETPQRCPRCDERRVRVLTTSPVARAWTMYTCDVCFYSWRSTEPPSVTDPATYPAAFKIIAAEIPDMPVVPTIPPRRS
jgi:vanillate/4-hydroxybenzoate decarboxylase subunit D